MQPNFLQTSDFCKQNNIKEHLFCTDLPLYLESVSAKVKYHVVSAFKFTV